MLVTQSGTYPARAAQAGVRLPPTLEADKPDQTMSNILGLVTIFSRALFVRKLFKSCNQFPLEKAGLDVNDSIIGIDTVI